MKDDLDIIATLFSQNIHNIYATTQALPRSPYTFFNPMTHSVQSKRGPSLTSLISALFPMAAANFGGVTYICAIFLWRHLSKMTSVENRAKKYNYRCVI